MAASPRSSTSTESENFYRISWRSHRPILSTAFENYFQTQTLTDVTLVCDNGESVNCHKIVLAACSPWFEEHLMVNKHRPSLILVPDVQFSELMDILDYMYKGEVVLAQEEIGDFLKAAKKLEVKGLTLEDKSEETEDGEEEEEENGKSVEQNLSSPSSSSSEEGAKKTDDMTPLLVGMRTYKKYTEEAINGAIQAVREGTSPLSAARQFLIPARTLYEKLKKLGIQTPRSVRYSLAVAPEMGARKSSGQATALKIARGKAETQGGGSLMKKTDGGNGTEAKFGTTDDDDDDYDSDVMVIDEFPAGKQQPT